jgi:hypothetical protein
VVDKINYLGVIFESSSAGNRRKPNTTANGNQILVPIARTPDIRAKILENVCEILSESSTTYDKDIWNLR